MDAIPVSSRPGAADWGKDSRHFSFRLRSSGGGSQFGFWSCGSMALRSGQTAPDISDIMGSLLCDADTVADRDFFEFCDDLGFDRENPAYARSYRECVDSRRFLMREFGAEFQSALEWSREL